MVGDADASEMTGRLIANACGFIFCLQNNVAGALCDECKPGFFHLSENNPEGCLQCFCMGVTKQCASSTWSRDQAGFQANYRQKEWLICLILRLDSVFAQHCFFSKTFSGANL